MTLDDLVEILNDLRDEQGGDAEVRFMGQQNYPFEFTIAGVTTRDELRGDCDECNGSKKCIGCDGDCKAPDGESACRSCGGSGNCPQCADDSNPAPDGKDFDGDATPAKTVFLVERRQARYGSKKAWDIPLTSCARH